MKLLLSALVVASAPLALAQSQIEFEFEAPVLSRYVWRGMRVSQGPVVQPSLTANKDKWSVNLWGSFESTEEHDDCQEVDTTLAYTSELLNWELTTGFSYYSFPNSQEPGTGELFVSVSHGDQVTLAFDAYADVEQADGAYFRASVARIWAMNESDSLEFVVGLGLGSRSHNDYYFGSDKAGLVDATASLAFSRSLNDTSSAALFAGYSTMLDRGLDAGGPRDSLFVGAGISARF